MIGLLVVLIAVIAVAVTRLPTGTLARPGATTTTASARALAGTSPKRSDGAPARTIRNRSVARRANRPLANKMAIASAIPLTSAF